MGCCEGKPRAIEVGQEGGVEKATARWWELGAWSFDGKVFSFFPLCLFLGGEQVTFNKVFDSSRLGWKVKVKRGLPIPLVSWPRGATC